MAAKRKTQDQQAERTKLIISKEDFKDRIGKAIEVGQELVSRSIDTEPDLNRFIFDCSAWDDFNLEILKASFNNDYNEYWRDYDNSGSMTSLYNRAMHSHDLNPLQLKLRNGKERAEAKLQSLQQLYQKVALLMSDVENTTPYTIQNSQSPLANLHVRVQQVAGPLYESGHYRSAIFDTYLALSVAVKDKSGLTIDNTPLMQSAFSPRNPVLSVSTDTDEQQGYMWLFSGAMMGIRNPLAHRFVEHLDPQRTLEWLSFASVLFRVLDDSTKL